MFVISPRALLSHAHTPASQDDHKTPLCLKGARDGAERRKPYALGFPWAATDSIAALTRSGSPR